MLLAIVFHFSGEVGQTCHLEHLNDLPWAVRARYTPLVYLNDLLVVIWIKNFRSSARSLICLVGQSIAAAANARFRSRILLL